MNVTRTGKIARLPRHLRDQLNRRLENGEQAKPLAAWLNSLPEVQAILAADFAGNPIRPQNLSEWKQGGYRDWLLQQEALDLARRLAEDMSELQAAVPSPSPPAQERAGERRPPFQTLHGSTHSDRPPLTDLLALWLAARYALATRTLATQDGPEQWRHLRELCADVVDLRRGDHSAARLKIEQERLTRERDQTEEELVEHFKRWVSHPKVADWIRSVSLDPEQHERRLREIFGLSPDDTANPAAHALAETDRDSQKSN